MKVRENNNILRKSKGKNNNAGITLVALVVTIALNCSFLAMVTMK